jgi:hypothetical protein
MPYPLFSANCFGVCAPDIMSLINGPTVVAENFGFIFLAFLLGLLVLFQLGCLLGFHKYSIRANRRCIASSSISN